MESANNGTATTTYNYSADGTRTSKVVGGVTHTYYYSGGKLLRETYGSTVLDFFYDANGTPIAMKQNGAVYYYVTNLQGNVVRLVNSSGSTAAYYKYDPYGNATTASGSHATINPLRYRGYYYDTETGLYYCQSRYYDPAIGRWINADDFTSTGHGILGHNMFTYCLNNPICVKDSTGGVPAEAVDIDDDGDIDYYRYDYTYVEAEWIGFRCVMKEVSGSIYIFPDIGVPGNLNAENYPSGFDSRYDLLVGYYVDTSGENNNPVMYAYQAQKVLPGAMRPIIEALQQYDEDFDTPWDRTSESLYVEWDAHRQLSVNESAQNVDFDNREEGKGYLYYYWKAFCRVINL